MGAGVFAIACGSSSPSGDQNVLNDQGTPPPQADAGLIDEVPDGALSTTPSKPSTPTDAGPITIRDSAVSDAPVGDAAALSSIATLFPVAVGRSWTFQITSNIPECNGTHTGQVIGEQIVGTQTLYQISSYCEGFDAQWVAVSATSADVDVNGNFVPQLAAPVAEGVSFSSFEGQTTWHYQGQVTVPLGSFPGCWRATSGSSYVDYCPNVGTVHIHEEHQDGTIDALLSAKNF